MTSDSLCQQATKVLGFCLLFMVLCSKLISFWKKLMYYHDQKFNFINFINFISSWKSSQRKISLTSAKHFYEILKELQTWKLKIRTEEKGDNLICFYLYVDKLLKLLKITWHEVEKQVLTNCMTLPAIGNQLHGDLCLPSFTSNPLKNHLLLQDFIYWVLLVNQLHF